MAQPANYIIDYRGGLAAKAGTTYTASDLPVGITMVEMRTSGVSISIDGTDAFPIDVGMQNYFNDTSKYTFTKDCHIAYGTIVDIV